MEELIIQAIRERQLLRLIYEGRRRITVEPHVLGRTRDGEGAILAWQVAPPVANGTGWRLLRLDRIMELQRLQRPFEMPPGERQPPAEEFSRVEFRA